MVGLTCGLARLIWTKIHQSYNILQWRREEKVIKIIKQIPNDMWGITTRGVRFGLPCWWNILRQEYCLRFESLHKQDWSCLAWMIIVDQNLKTRTLDWDSNHSTSKVDHVELKWFYMQPKLHRIAKKLSHWLKKAQMLLLLYFTTPLTNTTYKNETIKGITTVSNIHTLWP